MRQTEAWEALFWCWLAFKGFPSLGREVPVSNRPPITRTYVRKKPRNTIGLGVEIMKILADNLFNYY